MPKEIYTPQVGVKCWYICNTSMEFRHHYKQGHPVPCIVHKITKEGPICSSPGYFGAGVMPLREYRFRRTYEDAAKYLIRQLNTEYNKNKLEFDKIENTYQTQRRIIMKQMELVNNNIKDLEEGK